MSESDYLAEVQRLPRPTDDQVEAFVEYALHAHSWYKHLPWLPPGTPFVFFMDPGVIRLHPHLGVSMEPEAPSNSNQLAYFGHLDYHRYVTDRHVTVETHDGQRRLALPDSIHTLGTVYLAGAVHSWAQANPFVSEVILGRTAEAVSAGRWFLPASRPEDATLAAIVDLVERFPSNESEVRRRVQELCRDFLPVYAAKKKAEVRTAVHSVLDHIYGVRSSAPASVTS